MDDKICVKKCCYHDFHSSIDPFEVFFCYKKNTYLTDLYRNIYASGIKISTKSIEIHGNR